MLLHSMYYVFKENVYQEKILMFNVLFSISILKYIHVNRTHMYEYNNFTVSHPQSVIEKI